MVVGFGLEQLKTLFEALQAQQAARDPEACDAELLATFASVYSDFAARYPAHVVAGSADGYASIEPNFRVRSLA
ncbi:hypothetical protein QE375_003192 [Microbacterium foliorum]|uniref:Uncharacterized protein n=1 Tax=Microbacterium foliorum TaxID=104336 RepID=A0ABU1HUA8_9MICO|nr:hypothetical protein [Microbacterium foliorum]MDR6143638.1 hypothetical protein [Microbacterium foliorum]